MIKILNLYAGIVLLDVIAFRYGTIFQWLVTFGILSWTYQTFSRYLNKMRYGNFNTLGIINTKNERKRKIYKGGKHQ